MTVDLRRPRAEVDVDVALARHLLETQHPGMGAREIEVVDEGWDNVTFRIGRDHALRLPRHEAAAELLQNELRWLPHVAPWLDVAVPLPVAVGAPAASFPWTWSVVRWVPGRPVAGSVLSDPDARTLARALRSLHRPAHADAPSNPFRGVPLRARREVVEERLARLRLAVLRPIWRRALEAPPARDSVWIHGDLHARNVLVERGRLSGLIDWGDMTAGDPATDLACAWMLFRLPGRAAFRRAYGPTDAEWIRAGGWAVNFGSAMLDSGEPAHVALGQAIIEQLVGDPPGGPEEPWRSETNAR